MRAQHAVGAPTASPIPSPAVGPAGPSTHCRAILGLPPHRELQGQQGPVAGEARPGTWESQVCEGRVLEGR